MQTNNISFGSVKKPWLSYYQEKYRNASLPKRTMYEMVYRGCVEKKKMQDIAVYYYGTELTYRELFEQIEHYAAAFAHCGVKQGDYVTFLTVSIPESIFSIYALNRLGAVCNFIDVRTDTQHVREFIRKAKSHVLITLEQSYAAVADVLDELDLRLVICQTPAQWLPFGKRLLFRMKSPRYAIPYDGKRVIRDADFAHMGEGTTIPDIPYQPDYPAVITRTGGTTGVSKGVVLTNDSMNAIAFNFIASFLDHLPPYHNSLLNFLPLGSSYGIAVGVHMSFCLTLKNIMIPNFKPEEFDRLVWRFKPNHIIAVPVFYQLLATSPRLKGKDLSFIHACAAGGDAANDALEDKLEEFRLEHGMPYPITQGYGLSEASSAVSFGFRDLYRRGSVGIPSVSAVIAAFRPGTEEELPLGQKGELCVSGASLMKEYLDEPEETDNVLWLHKDGSRWIHTGDLGYVDEDGFVYVVGRIKRSIIRFDGHKVYPLQLERLVMQHPDVRNCVTISVKDREHTQGDLPLIVVELTDSSLGNETMRQELLAYCLEGIEMRSQPADVVFVEKIPLTKMAKNDYRRLEADFGDYNYLRDDQSSIAK